MTGHLAFLIGTSLIYIPRCVIFLRALMTDQSWFYPAIGAGLALNLTYCAWRGERWAYYLLIFLSALELFISGFLLVAVSHWVELILLVLLITATLAGLILLVVHPGPKEYMDAQTLRFKH